MTTNDHRPVLRGELVLVLAVIINSIGVLLMLHSGSGISAISSVPYAFNLVFAKAFSRHMDVYLSGTSCLCPYDTSPQIRSCLFISFVVGFCFGKMMDINELLG